MTTGNIQKDSGVFAQRMLDSSIGALEMLSVYLGDKLGLYGAMKDGGSVTAAELATATGCHERYVREWLEQQAVNGIVVVATASSDATTRRYALPESHAEVLSNPESLDYMAPISKMLVSVTNALPEVIRAFRDGGGVTWSAYGDDGREGQAAMNRPVFFRLLPDWLALLPDVHRRLLEEPPARIADIGCGEGWASIALAQHYPRVRVDGFDTDTASIEQANQHMLEAALGERVTFYSRDIGGRALEGRYDVALIFEALHDMARPVEVLQSCRRLLAPGGSVIVVDERVAEQFTAPGDQIERMMYGWSILSCLPAGMSEKPSAATGTVMRPETLRRYATEAGFSEATTVEVGHRFFRMYRLIP